MSHCRYCSNGLDEIKGEVYCSKHMTSFDNLKTGMFPINGTGFDSGDHVSRFSIRFVLGGSLTYTIDRSQYQIYTPTVALFNEFVDYSLKVPFQSGNTSQVGIAVNPAQLRLATAAFTEDAEKLLDNPETKNELFKPVSNVWNFSKKAESLSNKLQTILHSKDTANTDVKDDILSDIFEWYFEENSRYGGFFMSLQDVKKKSTKEELIRRMEIARELIQFANPSTLTVSDLAKKSSLSEFHFIRLYKKMYGRSPYQDVLQKKMKKALQLLQTTSLSIFEVAMSVGYEDQSSLSRLFKHHFGKTPFDARKEAAFQ
jgi:AraC family transcriptional regulator